MEPEIPQAPFHEGQDVWQRACTLDMGLERTKFDVVEIFYHRKEQQWRIRVAADSAESYPACYFQDSEPEPIVSSGAMRKVPRYPQGEA